VEGSVTWRNAIMSKLVVRAFSISLDGYGAALEQSLENPFGKGGMVLPQWAFPTRTFQKMFGKEDGETGIDEDFAARSFENIGAWILGRNMFGPVRGPWPDDSWKGWWGDTPPYHVPVFVLTHHARPSIEMKGGTTFHFVTDGIDSALRQAREAAGGKDVRVGGGVATVRQYLVKGLIDEMHLAQAPVLLGSGESLFAGIDLAALGYACTEQVGSSRATHFTVKKQG
jgi:dihydrofolate reductase